MDIRLHFTERGAGGVPGAQLAFVAGTHFAASENPDAFNRVVGSFLGGRRTVRT